MTINQTSYTDTIKSFKDDTNIISNNTGDLTMLTTTDKSSIVNAINEVNNEANLTKTSILWSIIFN